MPRVSIDYATLSDDDKRKKALADIRNYLGDKYDSICAKVADLSPRDLTVACGFFLGIEGYPVLAWYEDMHGIGSWVAPGEIVLRKVSA